MSKMSIHGAEYPIRKIFSDDFVFTVPLYQRAYAWTTEESEELLQDLLRAIGSGEESIDDLSPYFLGSIVLIKGDEPDAQIVDGQQRLTTLTMLLSALRSLSNPQYIDSLTSFLCEKGNIITKTPKRYRLRLRERDAKFFHRHIQDEDGIEELKKLQDAQLPESQTNIRDNTLGFIRELQKLSENQLITLTQFIINRCFLVVVSVSTEDLDSAYRIFSVLNSRGMDLSYPDILKSEIISSIPTKQQEDYTTKWEEVESLLGRETFEELFFHLRAIFSRERQRKGMIEEFHEYVYPGNLHSISPQEFIDNILIRYGQALNFIVKANYSQGPHAKEISRMFKWLNQLDHGRWIPPALYFFFEQWSHPDLVLRFLTDLERLVASFVICRVPPYRRIDRYCDLLKAIHDEKDLFEADSPLQLTAKERYETLKGLNGDMYFMHHICRYVLLRLDTKLSESTATYDHEKVSIEHVLPQRPALDSEWVQLFPGREIRDKYVNRLGNLVLLSRGKNMRAENFDFDVKKQKYFMTNDGISSFVLTTQVLRYHEWTPAIIEKRQGELIGALKSMWKL
ncbi:MAG: DUF262 domain-containing protein [Ktedonobacteraceae bacterium]